MKQKKITKYMAMKDKIDRVLAMMGLAFLWPVFVVIIILIKLEDGIMAPVFFAQKRVGINKTYFQLYKFSSMTELDKEAAGRLAMDF